MSRPTRRVRALKERITEAEKAWDEARRTRQEYERREELTVKNLRELRDLLNEEVGRGRV